MATVFDKILDTTTGRKSYDWYKRKVQAMTTPSAKTLISQGKATLRPKYGVMNLFGYDPKHKDKLPYYDVFPMIMLIGVEKDTFLGLNFHYLPPKLRAILLDRVNAKVAGGVINWKKISKIPVVEPTAVSYTHLTLPTKA